MTDFAPCPICGSTPKMHQIKTGFALSCVGPRHTVVMTDEGFHAAALYRGKTKEEVTAFWNKKFGGEATNADAT